jgi:hypothetical protein
VKKRIFFLFLFGSSGKSTTFATLLEESDDKKTGV